MVEGSRGFAATALFSFQFAVVLNFLPERRHALQKLLFINFSATTSVAVHGRPSGTDYVTTLFVIHQLLKCRLEG